MTTNSENVDSDYKEETNTYSVMDEIRTLKRGRGGAQAWVTKLGPILLKGVDEFRKSGEVSLNRKLQLDFAKFQEKVEKLNSLQEQLEHLLDGQELEDEVDRAIEYCEVKVNPVWLAVEEVLAPQVSDTPPSGTDNQSGVGLGDSFSQGGRGEAKLPKLSLPVFTGDIKKWTEFHDLFQAMVHKLSVPDITKFSYLKSVLGGEAKAAIEGLALTASNYATALELLEERFGRKEQITFAHIQDLLAVTVPDNPSVSELWAVYNEIKAHIRSLEALGISGEQYGVLLTPIILTRLPADLRMEWARGGAGKEADQAHLMTFLQEEIRRRERSQTYTGLDSSPPAAAALHTAGRTERRGGGQERRGGGQERRGGGGGQERRSGGGDKYRGDSCAFCDKNNHKTTDCLSLKKVPLKERMDRVKDKNMCFRCLKSDDDHTFRHCKARCIKCGGKHHELLCLPKQHATDRTHTALTTITPDHDLSHSHTDTVLQTIKISVRGDQGRKAEIIALFDTGSDRTYISQEAIERVGAKRVNQISLAYASFGSDTVSRTEDRNVHAVKVSGIEGGGEMEIQATAIPIICAPVTQPSVPTKLLSGVHGRNLVSVKSGKKIKIDLLIGLDHYWKFMTGEIKFLSTQLVAQKSTLGWVLSGCVPSREVSVGNSVQLFCRGVKGQPEEAKNFWDLETIGIRTHTPVSDKDQVLREFEDRISYTGTRYQVSLPWKEGGKERIVENKGLAMKRLNSLTARLDKDPELSDRYHGVIDEMWKEGIIEEVENDVHTDSTNPVYYLPHHPVVKEASVSTKIRPVFDASAKSYNRVSLNDCMEVGPNMLPDLVGVLLRFRRWKYALTADVRKAFLQVEVRPEDRDVHRFLWNDNGVVRIMRFTRVPFGNKGSPFPLMATIQHYLAQMPETQVGKELADNLYMDDLLTGNDTEGQAGLMFTQAQAIMKGAGMDLTKWGSNSQILCSLFGEGGLTSGSLGVLGLKWDSIKDVFCFDGLKVPADLCLTKRVILSLISQLFDPLGLLTPFTIRAKCLFQDIWREGFDWDQVVGTEMKETFSEWLNDLALLRNWSIPRRFFSALWSAGPKMTLHGFGDASEKGYGACIYLVAEGPGGIESALIMSRARVAPLKTVTLPRLELLGALLCARLIVYVRDSLKLQHSVPMVCWTDSTVTLAWIKGEPLKWKTFVRNRVTEIQNLVDPSSWHHCPGKDNPADLLTRGISADELMKSDVWLHGPTRLLSEGGSAGKASDKHEMKFFEDI